MADTLAEALDVALDRATETGEYSEALRRRIAEVLPGLRIATGWAEEYSWIQRYAPNGAIVAMYGTEMRAAWVRAASVSIGRSRVDDEDGARAWCDEQLSAAGWVLIGGTDEVHRG